MGLDAVPPYPIVPINQVGKLWIGWRDETSPPAAGSARWPPSPSWPPRRSDAAACGAATTRGSGAAAGKPVTLRLGYFPNITHAPAIVGVEKGIFAEKLGSDVKLETKTFNAGPAAIEAIFSGALDATYIGPNPTVNAYSKSKGEAVRVISGAASGGVALVVKPGITTRRGPQGQEDRHPAAGQHPGRGPALLAQGEGPRPPPRRAAATSRSCRRTTPQTLETFSTGAIDGAWVPEPFVSRLVNAGGKVLVDERDLWPDSKFVITNLIVSTKFLKEHPDVVKKLVDGPGGRERLRQRQARRGAAGHLRRTSARSPASRWTSS